MSLEVNPVGVTCNMSCPYCYEHPQRDAGNFASGYDMDAMKKGLASVGGPFSLFGGEPLLMKIADVEELLRWGFERNGHNGIQTNGSLITPAHIDLFIKYKCYVGISVDGPDELNDTRWVGTLEKTRAATAASMQAIQQLCERRFAPSLIVTLHRGNASVDRLPKLLDWLTALDRMGVTSARLHALEIDHDSVRESLALTEDENVNAFLACMNLQDSLKHLRFDIFKDMTNQLRGEGESSCVWNACDPLTTPAVMGINGAGGKSNCSRTNKDGIDWVKSAGHGNERYVVLHQTPQEDGGCKDCRFFFACKGQCPGTAIDGDWRNRSEQCGLWMRLFETIENQFLLTNRVPISLDAPRRVAAEQRVLAGMQAQQEHGDHWDAPNGYTHDDLGFTIHGDQGMTRTHSDHSDA